MKTLTLLAILIFGTLMSLTTQSHAQEVESVYCRFDVKKWEGSVLKFLQQATDCNVAVDTKYGSFEYDQPLVPTTDALDFKKIWANLTNDG